MAQQRGPLYDDAVKALCALQPAALCRWLGVPLLAGARTVHLVTDLPTATRQVDALVAVDDATAVHIEFQATAERYFAHRMLDYLLRLVRQPDLAAMTVHQHVVVLGAGRIDHGLQLRGLDYAFAVHYLRDEPVERFLDDAGLSPFACLADLPDSGRRAETLRRALDLIAGVADDHTRTVLARAAVDLAGLRLDRGTISTTWEDSAMPIPSLTEQIRNEGRDEGREEALEQLTASLLQARFGPDVRIPAISRRLAALAPDVSAKRLNDAASLDDLAEVDAAG